MRCHWLGVRIFGFKYWLSWNRIGLGILNEALLQSLSFHCYFVQDMMSRDYCNDMFLFSKDLTLSPSPNRERCSAPCRPYITR